MKYKQPFKFIPCTPQSKIKVWRVRKYRCLCIHRHTYPMTIAHCSFWAQWHSYKLLTLSGWTCTTFEARLVNVLSNLSIWMLSRGMENPTFLQWLFAFESAWGALGEGFATSTRWPTYDEISFMWPECPKMGFSTLIIFYHLQSLTLEFLWMVILHTSCSAHT